jgi:hypothetical protein
MFSQPWRRTLQLRGERFGRLGILAFLVRQAGVGIAGNAETGHLGSVRM